MYQGNFFKSLMAKGIIAAPPQPESATNVPASAAEIGTQSGYATHQIEGLPPENPANA
jgi:hypothetical protein